MVEPTFIFTKEGRTSMVDVSFKKRVFYNVPLSRVSFILLLLVVVMLRSLDLWNYTHGLRVHTDFYPYHFLRTNNSEVGSMKPPASVCSNQPEFVRPVLPQAIGREIVKSYFEEQKRKNGGINKYELFQRLLSAATEHDKLLLTLQMGGHDGKTNDPLYGAFVRGHKEPLTHWLPIVVEPVRNNYAKLIQTYTKIHRDRQLPCKLPLNWAMSYNNERDGKDQICPFYRFNDADNAPEFCRNQPDWMKTQIGTISAEHLRKGRKAIFEQCFIVDKVSCGSVSDLMERYLGMRQAIANISLLQIDVEGYEAVLLPAFFNEVFSQNYELPPLIHFESKIVRKRDSKRLKEIHETLRQNGYYMLTGDDDLAIWIGETPLHVSE